MNNKENRVAVVTGAGRGTGRAIAVALGRAGARVACVDVNPDSADSTAALVRDSGGEASAHAADVANKMAVQTAAYAVLDAWGRVDFLVNAAHIGPRAPALTLDEWEWNRALDVNLKGTFLVSQTAARAMKETGGGVILNLIRPAEIQVAARAAREGLLGLTAALAEEWSPFGVRVETLDALPDPDATAREAVRRCFGRGDGHRG